MKLSTVLTEEEQELFSYNELSILQILGKNEMRISEIVSQLYGENKPVHASNVVSDAIKRIIRKCEVYGLGISLNYKGDLGRNGKSVSIKR